MKNVTDSSDVPLGPSAPQWVVEVLPDFQDHLWSDCNLLAR